MMKWFHKLMAGEQVTVPPGATVERDELGRVSHVKQTLSLSEGDEVAPENPTPRASAEFASRLREACDWLIERNIQLAREWGIGLERSFDFDQDTGRLVLKFGRRRKIVAQGQILGSFDPSDGSFMWAWANPSIRPEMSADVARLKAEGEQQGLAVLTSPQQKIKFDDLGPVLAYAAQQGRSEGIYRCLVNDSISVFVAFCPEGSPPVGQQGGGFDDELTNAARNLIANYDAEMLPIDREYHEFEEKKHSARELLEGKLEIYQRHWSRKDSYWKPRSFAWPSDHDPGTKRLRFDVPHPEGGMLDVSIGKHSGRNIYRIELVDGALKITDQLIDWGDGFLWPQVADSA